MNRRSFGSEKSTCAEKYLLSRKPYHCLKRCPFFGSSKNGKQRKPKTTLKKISYSQVCDPSAQRLPYCVKAVEWTQYSLRQREQQSIGVRRHNEYPLRTKLSQKWVAPRKSILARELSWRTGVLTTMMCKICQVFFFGRFRPFNSQPMQHQHLSRGHFRQWSNGDPWSKAGYPRS